MSGVCLLCLVLCCVLCELRADASGVCELEWRLGSFKLLLS